MFCLRNNEFTYHGLKCRIWWSYMLATPMCRFGDLLVATLKLSCGNKCHFHYYYKCGPNVTIVVYLHVRCITINNIILGIVQVWFKKYYFKIGINACFWSELIIYSWINWSASGDMWKCVPVAKSVAKEWVVKSIGLSIIMELLGWDCVIRRSDGKLSRGQSTSK